MLAIHMSHLLWDTGRSLMLPSLRIYRSFRVLHRKHQICQAGSNPNTTGPSIILLSVPREAAHSPLQSSRCKIVCPGKTSTLLLSVSLWHPLSSTSHPPILAHQTHSSSNVISGCGGHSLASSCFNTTFPSWACGSARR